METEKNFIINGHMYKVTHMPAMTNITIGCEILKMLDGTLSLGGLDSFTFLANKLLTLDPKFNLIFKIMSYTVRDFNGSGEYIGITHDTFDKFYRGRMGEFLDALIETLIFHFSHFLLSRLSTGNQTTDLTDIGEILKKLTENSKKD